MTEKQIAIKEMQDYLFNISKVNSAIPLVNPDGIFGEETKNAVEEFQKISDLEVNGKVDYETWEKLKEENKKALFILSEPLQVINIKNEDLPLVLGDKNKFVKKAILMLNHLGERFSNFNLLIEGDEFTEEMRDEVLKWQKIISHEESGQVDKVTWNSLGEWYLIDN